MFDKKATCADSIKAHLDATGRYKTSPYSTTDVIGRGMGLRMDDMHCQKCYNRIAKRLQQIEGVDSTAPHLDKHYVFIHYDANRTSKRVIRDALVQLGYTPVNYYTSAKVGYAYYNIPAEAATKQTIEEVEIMEGVDDVNVNPGRKTLAVTYITDETTADKLFSDIKGAGIQATLPPAHECKEELK